MRPILEIQNISKKFRIQHETPPYLSIRDSVASLFKPSVSTEDFYALKEINFNVFEGDSIGIIGKNGAGKSTLLKILSKITPPSEGKIIARGRIASLLEVGTGFHPELSGRENIFLNGSILGMKRKEIKQVFDEIVNFSGTEKFLDTPLKHYSSGMQLRLAFAVAAFLEPEILIIDEVLAVGDIEFQKKCIGKMEDVSTSGRTLLFVSHNMAFMRSLCKKGLLMSGGRITFEGSMNETVEHYLSSTSKTNVSGEIPSNSSSINTGIVKYLNFKLLDNYSNMVESINYLSPLNLYFEIDSNEPLEDALLDVRICSLDGITIAHAMNKYTSSQAYSIKKGRNVIHAKLSNHLQPGKYSFTIGIHKTNGATLEFIENIMDFSVSSIAEGENRDFLYGNFKLGYTRFESEWKIEN